MCLLISLGAINAFALSSNGLHYEISDSGEATITDYVGSEKTLILPKEIGGCLVTEIGSRAFEMAISVESITISEGVHTINSFAFNRTNIKNITIPSTLKYWNQRAFSFSSIENVYISDIGSWCNISYKGSVAEHGPLDGYNAKLYLNGELITKLVIPDGIEKIYNSRFEGCNTIKSVVLPSTITAIHTEAFAKCSGIKDVWYVGSEEDKAKVSIDSSNTYLLNATWHYNSCPVGAPHEYSNDCDAECNGCGLNRDVPDHKYDNACDTDCNVCKAIRQTQHTYDNSCDTECNICKAKRNITHSYGQWSTVKKADCTTSGTQNRECSVCHHIDSKNVDPLNHDYETKWTVDEAADCTGAGSKSHHCTRCDAKKDITTIPAEGHTWGKWTTVKEPTTTAEGKSERKCKVCNETETQSIAKLAEDGHTHIFGDWKISKAATCIETGKAERACSICQEKETKEIVATGHQVGEWEEIEPTCTEEGYRERKCLVCKESEKEIEKALGHDFDKDGKCLRCGLSSSEDVTEEEKEDQTVNENQSNNGKDQGEEQQQGEKPSYWWILWVALAAVAGAGVSAVTILISKKKK